MNPLHILKRIILIGILFWIYPSTVLAGSVENLEGVESNTDTIVCSQLLNPHEMPKVSQVPITKMQALLPLAGTWELVVEMTNDDGASWKALPRQEVAITPVHKSMVLQEKPLSTDGAGFHMLSYLSFDQYRNVYRKAAIDDVWGVMDLYEGNFIDGKLVMTNLAAKTFFPIEKGKFRGFKLTIEIAKNKRIMTIDKTDDNGKSWQPAFIANYRQIKAFNGC